MIVPCPLAKKLVASTAHATTYSTSTSLATASALSLNLRSAARVSVLDQVRADLSLLGNARDLPGSSASSGSYAISHDTLAGWS
jgi:hypothetical protein